MGCGGGLLGPGGFVRRWMRGGVLSAVMDSIVIAVRVTRTKKINKLSLWYENHEGATN